MADELPPIIVDSEVDLEGGQFEEESLTLGSTASSAKIVLPGEDDFSKIDISSPTSLSEGISIEVRAEGVMITRTIYDNRQRARCFNVNMSFNSEDSEKFMSIVDDVLYDNKEFQNKTFNDILKRISDKSKEYPGASINYNGNYSKLDQYAGPITLDNIDIVSAFTKVLERAGRFSWWLKRNPGTPSESMFSDIVEIIDLDNPEDIDVANLKINISEADFSGSEECPVSGVIVMDKDGRGSKKQFGIPEDLGRDLNTSARSFGAPPPVKGGPITVQNILNNINLSKYDISSSDYGLGRKNIWTIPKSDGSNDLLIEDMQLSINNVNGKQAIFNVFDVSDWPNAEPVSSDLNYSQDFIKIERRMITHPNIEPVFECLHSSFPTVALIETFHERFIDTDNQYTIVSTASQFDDWKKSKAVTSITSLIDQGKDNEFYEYSFKEINFNNTEGGNAKKVALILRPREQWTSIPEIKVDFDRGYIFIPNKYFFILGAWDLVSEISWTTDSNIASGASSTSPKLTIDSSFEEALLASKIRMIGVLSRSHKIARVGSKPYSIVKKGDYESTNVPFNASNTDGYRVFSEKFDDYSSMQDYAGTLLTNNRLKSSSKGKITIYPGNQSVFPGKSTKNGIIVRVHHRYIPYFITDLDFSGSGEGEFSLENLELRRSINEVKESVDITDQSVRSALGGATTKFSGAGPASLVPPHTHSDQFSGGTALGHITVKSLTIEGESVRGADDSGPAFNLTSRGDTASLDLRFDKDKGKFVVEPSIFIDKEPNAKRVETSKANESTKFSDQNPDTVRQDGVNRPKSGYSHQIFDFVSVGQGSTDNVSRIALNIVPHGFEPFDATHGEDSNSLRNWGGDRIYIGDSYDRPGFLSAYTSNQILLYSKFNENDNTNQFKGNNFLNETPAAVIGVRKPGSSNAYLDSLFNKDAESIAFAGVLMSKEHDYQSAFVINPSLEDDTGTDLEFAFPEKSGFWFGTHFNKNFDNENDSLFYSKIKAGAGSSQIFGGAPSTATSHIYQFANKSEIESGFGVRAGVNTGISRAVDHLSGQNTDSIAFDVYNIQANNQDLSFIRGISTSNVAGGSVVFFSTYDKSSPGLSNFADARGESSTIFELRGQRVLFGAGINGINDVVGDIDEFLSTFTEYFDVAGQVLKTSGENAIYPFKVTGANESKGGFFSLVPHGFEISLKQPVTGYSSDQRPRFLFQDSSLILNNGNSDGGELSIIGNNGNPYFAKNQGWGGKEILLTGTVIDESVGSFSIPNAGVVSGSGSNGQYSPTYEIVDAFEWMTYDIRGGIVSYGAFSCGVTQEQFEQLLESFDGLVEDFDGFREEIYNSLAGYSGGPTGAGSNGNGVSFADLASILSFVIDALFGAIEDLAEAIDDLAQQVQAILDKLEKVQEELKKLRTSIKSIVLRITIVLGNKRRKEGTGTGPSGGGTTPGGTTPGVTTPGSTDTGGVGDNDILQTGEVPTLEGSLSPLGIDGGEVGTSSPAKDDEWWESLADSIYASAGEKYLNTPVGPVYIPGFGSATGECGYIRPLGSGQGCWLPEDGGGGLEPGGGEEGEFKDNKSSLTGLSLGIEAATGNAAPSIGSSAANRRVTQYAGLNDWFAADEITNSPILEPDNEIYNRYKSTGRIPFGMSFNPFVNPNIYLRNAPGVEIGTAQTLWAIGGGGGSPAAATGVSYDSLAPQHNPLGVGWDKTQDVRSILQLANRTPTVELDAAGRWVIVGGGHLFPTMLDGSGQIRISDDSTSRVAVGGMTGFLVGAIKDLAGFEMRPELIVSQKAFGIVGVDDEGNKLISNNFGVFKSEVDVDGKYKYLDNSSVPIYGGVIGELMNKVDRYNSLIPSTNTGLFSGGSLTNIVANSSLEEAIIALDSAVKKHNTSATSDPGVGDDSADGYTKGSFWLNNTDDGVFYCADNSAGAAVWVELTGAGGSGSLQDAYDASTDPEIVTDSTRGALTLKRGSAADTDKALEIQNSAGSTRASIQHDGATALQSLTLVTALSKNYGGTGATNATDAFDALSPATTKGDLISHNGTDNVRVAVGSDGYPLIADAASSAGVKWATQKETLTWWVLFDRRPYTGTAASSPPTIAVADGTLQDSTSASTSAGRNMTDGNVTWHMVQFPIPDELDKTEAVDAKVYFRLANNASSGDQVEFTTRLRASYRDELVVSAGTFREVSGTVVLTGYSAGDLGICSMSDVLAANDTADDDFVHGVLERDATAGNADDTYAATVNVYAIKFVGKRKVRS